MGNISTMNDIFCFPQGREKFLKGSVNLLKSVIQIQKYFQFPRPRFQADAERRKLWRAVKRFMEAPQITTKPALDGMWVTLVNKASPKQLIDYVANSSKVVNKVLGSVVKSSVESFEISNDNSLRSVKALYSNGLLSKEKYKAIRSNLSMSCNNNNYNNFISIALLSYVQGALQSCKQHY